MKPADVERLARYISNEGISTERYLKMKSDWRRSRARGDLLEFARAVYPHFITGRHHHVLAENLKKIATGELRRLIISVPPRHSKSLLASFLFPAWYIGAYPDRKLIITSNIEKLAVGFGRQVRNLITSSEVYQSIFPDLKVSKDAKAAGLWTTSAGGEFFAIGVGGTVTGRGANVFLIDDPHSEQDALVPDGQAYDKTWDWYLAGPRQRLQPNAGIVIVATRWHTRDLIGRILDKPGKIPWTYISLPALDEKDEPLWPEFWPREELVALRADLPIEKWECQYQQQPVSSASSVVKYSDWRIWPPAPTMNYDWRRVKGTDAPFCEFVVQAWDTSYAANRRSNYSACVTFGTFVYRDDKGIERDGIILLDAFQEQLEFPQLKKWALEGKRIWEPDAILIEAKTAGYPLLQEFRQSGIPVEDFCPTRGDRKEVRVNSIADLFASGMVWRMEGEEHGYADAVAKQFAEFPRGAFDDLVDAGTMCLMRIRRGGLARFPREQDEQPGEKFADVQYY